MKFLLITVILALGVNSILAGKPCDNILPGLQRMTRGIDITKLDLVPSDMASNSGFQQALFDLTCDEGKKFIHPSEKDFTFPVPDQVSAVNTVPGGALNQKVTFSSHTNEFKKNLGFKIGLDVPTEAYGDYSLSFGYKDAQEQLLVQNRTIAEVSSYVSAIQMDFKPHFNLKPNENFRAYEERLKASKFDKDPDIYQDFLDEYGTHYFESGIFGGYLYQQIIIDNDFLYKKSDQEINANINAGYLKMVGLKFDIDHSKTNSSIDFKRATTTNSYYYGGKANFARVLDEKTFTEWVNSVPSDPWLFGGRIKPIENLFTDSAVKTEMKRAISVKVAKAYLQEMRSTIQMIKKDQITKEIKDIDHCMQQSIPDQTEVQRISKIVQQMMVDAQAEKDRIYIDNSISQLQKVVDYELFCKQKVAEKCFHETKTAVNDSIEKVEGEKNALKDILHNEQVLGKSTNKIRAMIQEAMETVHFEQNDKFPKCRELMVCNICKARVINELNKVPCESTHIKELMNVHV